MSAPDRTNPIGKAEFIALVAMLAGTVAYSIDAMLPAMPEIMAATGADEASVQFVITSFVLGMGIGTLFSGPLSDAIGRRPTVVAGGAIYCLGALIAASASSLEVVLAARALQGFGAAGPRVAALSIVRDLYAGRQMAKIVSFVMVVFALIPTIAPSLGALTLYLFNWRVIFVSFAVFSVLSVVWLLIRLPETLPADLRRPFSLANLRSGIADIMGRPDVVYSILAQSIVFGILFAALAGSQPLFASFGRGDSFHFWFGAIALISTTGSFLNALVVEKLGMRRVVRTTLTMLVGVSAALLCLFVVGALPGDWGFAAYVIWQIAVFTTAGLTIGNLNALAMEPVGHIAGLAASIIAATATILGALLAMPASFVFDGTPRPIIGLVLLLALAGVAFMQRVPDREAP